MVLLLVACIKKRVSGICFQSQISSCMRRLICLKFGKNRLMDLNYHEIQKVPCSLDANLAYDRHYNKMLNSNENQNFLSNFQVFYPSSNYFLPYNGSTLMYSPNEPTSYHLIALPQIEIQTYYQNMHSFLGNESPHGQQIPAAPTSSQEDLNSNLSRVLRNEDQSQIEKSPKTVKPLGRKRKGRKKDLDFRPKFNSYQTKIEQTRGRNKYSNVYRAFIKLISAKPSKEILKIKVHKIVDKYKLDLSFEDFQVEFMDRFPTFTNYINRGEFSRFYLGNSPLNFLFRVLFQDFLRNQAHTHVLSVAYKNKMKRESIEDFLSGLRSVHQEVSQVEKSSE